MISLTGPPGRPQAAAAALWLVAGAIATVSATQGTSLDGSAWVLTSLPGHRVIGTAATLRFEAGRATGSDGCNRFSTTYTATASSLRFDAPGISTQMACPDPVAQQAMAFTNAMSRTRSHRTEAGRLHLLGEDGGVLAMFDPQPLTLAGTSWEVTGFNNGKEAVVSPIVGTSLTMTFGADGNLSGGAGCNTYTAPVTSAGSGIAIGPPAATRRSCAQPQGVMEQEQQFLRALPTARSVRLEGNRLEMRTEVNAGAMVVNATRQGGK
jgi:heat shock protein HslJ